MGFPGGSEVKASACNAGDPGSISGLGRSPGGGHGNPLQYSCLENPMDRGAWQLTVHGVTKRRTWRSNQRSLFTSQITLSITISWFSKSLLLSCHMVHVLSRYVFPFMFIPLKSIPSLPVITSKNRPVQWCISLPSLRTTSAVPGIPEFYFFLKYPLT